MGQSFGCIPPGVDSFGKPHKVRLYSIASPSWGEDGKGNVLSTTVKRVMEEFRPQTPKDDAEAHHLFLGVCSNYMCDIKVGDRDEDQRAQWQALPAAGESQRSRLHLHRDRHGHCAVPRYGAGALEEPRSAMHEPDSLPDGLALHDGSDVRRPLPQLEKEHSNFYYHVAISRESNNKIGLECRGEYVDRCFERLMPSIGSILQSPRALVYICGLAGMQVGLFKCMAKHGVGEPYMTLKPEIAAIDPAQWTEEQIKRHIRPTRRCMLEVY